MQIKLDDLEKRGVLGEGTYGKCYLVKHPEYEQLWVLKQIQTFGLNDTEKQEVIREAKLLESFDHPFIIKFLGFFTEASYLNILMEFADDGDLNKKIKDTKKSKEGYMAQEKILNCFVQICLALKHVHDRKIIHRDIKSQNIFLTKEGKAKLGDFGIAKPLRLTLQKMKTVVGTPYYMSPEICENKSYSYKTDIWSLGVILYELCALKPPFDANSLPSLALKITKGDYPSLPSFYSRELKQLISSLLHQEPEKRPNTNKILQNPLLSKRISSFLPASFLKKEFSLNFMNKNLLGKENEKEQLQESINSKGQKKTPSLKNDIISPRNKGSQIKTPQHKNSDFMNRFKDSGSTHKDSKINVEKKKRVDSFKRRQISQPNLLPSKRKVEEKKSERFSQNSSMAQLEKKKEKKDTSFKKNKEAFISQIELIKECRNEVIELHEQYSQRGVYHQQIKQQQNEDEQEKQFVGEPFETTVQFMLKQKYPKKSSQLLKIANQVENPLKISCDGSGLAVLLWGLKHFQ